jgi:hypothetical protein
MATQRIIPIEEENVAAQPIAITSSGGVYAASPVACIILGSRQQGVSFSNTSGSTVAITFVPNPVNNNLKVFNDIPSLPSTGAPTYQTPQVDNGSVNYNIVVGGQSYGPFAIQVGNGPLQVFISMSGTTITCTPPTVAVPAYNNALGIPGTLEMIPDNVNNGYAIAWPGGSDPFHPPLTWPDSAPHGDTNATPVGNYNYTVNTPNPKEGGGGGGTVRIKSS